MPEYAFDYAYLARENAEGSNSNSDQLPLHKLLRARGSVAISSSSSSRARASSIAGKENANKEKDFKVGHSLLKRYFFGFQSVL